MPAIRPAGGPSFQPGRPRVPQPVQAMTAFPAHQDMSGPGVFDQDLMQMILAGERACRGGAPEEYPRAVTSWAAAPDAADDRPAGILEQRQLHPVAGLGLHHRQAIAGPAEITEPEPFHLRCRAARAG